MTHYEAYVSDGHIDYHGAKGYTVKLPARSEQVMITNTANIERFKTSLVDHQQGKTDFLTFIKMCATCGVEKWTICMNEMTGTYYDTAGKEMLIERIPS